MKTSFTLITAFLALALSFGCTKKAEDSQVQLAPSNGKKVFYHYRRGEFKSVDPQRQFDEMSAQIVRSVFDTLLQYDYLKRPYTLMPSLLESMPEKKGGTTYLFHVRHGVKFQDNACFPGGKGREMNANDVIYSLKRFADSNVNVLSYSMIQGLVDGMDAFREVTKKEGKGVDYSKHEISGVKKIDNYTVSVTFTSDSPLNFYPFAFSGMSIVPREAVEKYGEDFERNPVGTGAFTIKSYSRRGNMILAKNPHYWAKFPVEGMDEDKEMIAASGGKTLPFVDEVQLPLIEEPQTAMLLFRKKLLAWVALNKDDFSNVIDHKPGSTEYTLKKELQNDFLLYQVNTLGNNFLKFGMNDPVWGGEKGKLLRQAVAMALNNQGFIDLLLNGRANVTDSLVPWEVAGSARDTGSKWWPYDVEGAKKKLAEAGYPGGKGLPPLVVEYRSTARDQHLQYEYFRYDLSRIGVTLVPNFQTFTNFNLVVESGNFQICDTGWYADYPDPENFYALLFSENKAPLPNFGNYNNPKFDALYLKMKNMPNGPERFKLIAEMNEILKEDVPMVLNYDLKAVGLIQKNVKNFKRNMLDDYPYKYFDLKD